MIKNKKGFTLIELLVVIAIIGLLSTLAVISLGNARQKARDAKRVADIKNVQTALELFYTASSSYPTGTNLALGALTDCTTACDTISNAGIAATAGSIVYMGLIPADPTGTVECTADSSAACVWSYNQTDSGQGYNIYAYLEGATGSLSAGKICADETGIKPGGC